MFRLSSRAATRRVTVVSTLVATLALVACTPASASNVRIRHSLFGMHDGTADIGSLTSVHEGAIRLWDTGVQWQSVETAPGVYDWTRLDALVTAAQAHHAEVTMVVAGTPSFYSSTPWNVPGSQVSAYKAFVKALMQRYKSFNGKRGISAYQVWNEGNIATFWSGTPAGLAKLTQAMDQMRDKYDSHAKVIAPPMVSRLAYQLTGLSKFYHQRVGKKPVWRYVDAIGLSLYPLARYGKRTGVPEDAIKQLGAVKKLLRKDGVPGSKPIWNTEVNYGLQSGSKGGTAAGPVSNARQVANVMRTYLLNAAHGVKRVFWYRFDMNHLGSGGNLANTLLTVPGDPSSITPAGRAYLRIQQWMHGTLLGTKRSAPCPKDRHGTYTCVVKDSTGTRRIYWNPFGTGRVKLAGNAHHLTTELGVKSKVKPGSTIKVDYRPVLAGR